MQCTCNAIDKDEWKISLQIDKVQTRNCFWDAIFEMIFQWIYELAAGGSMPSRNWFLRVECHFVEFLSRFLKSIRPTAHTATKVENLFRNPKKSRKFGKFQKNRENSRKVFSNFLEFFGVSEQISDFGRSVWRARQCGNQLSCAIRSPFKSSPKGRKSSLFLHQWLKKPPSRHAEKPERHFGIRSNKTNGVMHYLKVLATGCVTRMVGLAD